MSDIDQVTQMDVTAESSTAPESDSAAASPEAPAQQAVAETTPKPMEAPFHEHPRFKELIEQNRSYKNDLANLQKQFAELSKPKAEPTPAHPFISDLEKINPEYANYLRTLENQVKDLSGLQSWKQDFETKQVLEKYESSVKSLLNENKVGDSLHPIYKELLDARAASGKYTLQDLPNVFKEVHSQLSGILNSQKRETVQSYVTDKAKAASIPASAPKTPSVAKKPSGWKPSGQAEKDIIDIARMAVEETRAKNSD